MVINVEEETEDIAFPHYLLNTENVNIKADNIREVFDYSTENITEGCDDNVINVEKEIIEDKTCKESETCDSELVKDNMEIQSEIFEMAKLDFKTLWAEYINDYF